MAPDGWEFKKLEDLCRPNAPITYGVLKPGEFYQGGIPLLQIKDLRDGCVLTDDLHLISPALDEEYKRSRILKNDILISLVGTIGRIAKYSGDSAANIHRNIGRIRSDCHEYLYYFLTSNCAQNEIGGSSSGSSQSALNLSTLRSMKIPTPPLAEQKKIAQILATWDKAITTTEQLIAISKQQKKALMQQLLTGKKRLRDKNEVRFSGEWKTTTLGQIGEIKSAGVDKKIVEGETPVRLLNFTDVFKRSFIYSNELNHWVTAPESKVSGCDVRLGDVFFTPSSETKDEAGIPAVAAEDIRNCCYSYHVVRFRIREQWDLNFKAYAFTTPEFRKQVDQLADGSGQRYVVSQNAFRSISITYPSYDEQIAIGRTLRIAEDEIKIFQKKLCYLKQEKKALMQQLLTGKRRVQIN